jgi:hypothetical protein
MSEGMFERIRESAKAMQEQLSRIVVEGTAGGGMVKVRMNAAMEVLGVTIDRDAFEPDELDLLQDLLAGAMADAVRRAQHEQQSKMAGMASSMGLDAGSLFGKMG